MVQNAFSGKNAATISGWTYITSFGSLTVLALYGSRIHCDIDDYGKVSMIMSGAGNKTVTTTSSLSANTLQMITFVFGNDTMKIYFGPTETATLTMNNPNYTLPSASIPLINTLPGRMDEVSFFNRALTPSEITTLFNNRISNILPLPPSIN
jgi:hypothetical protein